jgi:UDP-N-acetylglucosamine--N-acetylmuramyl-(pentapeptide) pyrophosphoryl-undecaprenol N-acetylglucosamine transferase
MSTRRVNLVIAFGGYSTFPCLVSSVILRKKIILHEQNSYMGKVNRIFLKYCKYAATSFKETQGIKDEYKVKIKYLGNPVREEIIELGKKKYNYPNFNKKYFSKNNLGYDLVLASDFEEVKKVKDDYFNILVIGGSGGAEIFSKILPKAFFNIRSELKNKINIFQQCRSNLLSNTFEQYQNFNLNVCLKDFFYDMDKKIEKSHLVIARSGSSTIFELASAKKPMILVPFKESSDNHQLKNAQKAKEYGGSIIIEEKDFNINNISTTIERLIDNPEILQKMSRDIYKFAEVNSTINFIKLIENM